MELAIWDPTYGRQSGEEFEGQELVIQELLDAGKEAFPELDVSVRTTDLGHGCDGPALAILVGLSAAFLSGKPIKENLRAWADLFDRFRRLLERLREQHRYVFLDKDSAIVHCLSLVAEQEPELLEQFEGVESIVVAGGTSLAHPVLNLEKAPEQLFVIVLRFQSKVVLAVVKSNGQVFLRRTLPELDYTTFWHEHDERDFV